MSDIIGTKSRLIHREDVAFDEGNANAVDSYVDVFGVERRLTRINASHIPLGIAASSATGKDNVSEALVSISSRIDDTLNKINEISPASDQSITLNGLTVDDLNALSGFIGKYGKRLDGHTLSVKITNGGTLAARFLISGVYGGKVEIDFNGSNVLLSSPIEISDCGGSVIIKNASFNHDNSDFAFIINRCFLVSFEGVTFHSDGTLSRFASQCFGSNVSYNNCVFENDGKASFYEDDTTFDSFYLIKKPIEDAIDSLESRVDSAEAAVDSIVDKIVSSGSSYGIYWSKYQSGRMEVCGSSESASSMTDVAGGRVFKISLPSGVSFADSNYNLIITEQSGENVELTFDEDGNPSEYKTIKKDSLAGRAVPVETGKAVDSFYVVAWDGAIEGADGGSMAFSWIAIGEASKDE